MREGCISGAELLKKAEVRLCVRQCSTNREQQVGPWEVEEEKTPGDSLTHRGKRDAGLVFGVGKLFFELMR